MNTNTEAVSAFEEEFWSSYQNRRTIFLAPPSQSSLSTPPIPPTPKPIKKKRKGQR